jgi:hypothetical protein
MPKKWCSLRLRTLPRNDLVATPKIRRGAGCDGTKRHLPEGLCNSFSGGQLAEIQISRRAIGQPCSTLEPPGIGRHLRFLRPATTILPKAACQSPDAETSDRRRCFPIPTPTRGIWRPENQECPRNCFRLTSRLGRRVPAFEKLGQKIEWNAGIALSSNERRSSNAPARRACAGCHRRSLGGLWSADRLSSYVPPGRWLLERTAGLAKISASERRM